jgi:hypothetical protein
MLIDKEGRRFADPLLLCSIGCYPAFRRAIFLTVAGGGVGASLMLAGSWLIVLISLWKLLAYILPAGATRCTGVLVHCQVSALLFASLALVSLPAWHPAHLVR